MSDPTRWIVYAREVDGKRAMAHLFGQALGSGPIQTLGTHSSILAIYLWREAPKQLAVPLCVLSL